MRGYSSCVRVSLVGDKAQFWGTYYTSGKLAGFAAGEGEIMNLLADPFTYGTEKLQHLLEYRGKHFNKSGCIFNMGM